MRNIQMTPCLNNYQTLSCIQTLFHTSYKLISTHIIAAGGFIFEMSRKKIVFFFIYVINILMTKLARSRWKGNWSRSPYFAC